MRKHKIEIGCLSLSQKAIRYVNEALKNNRLSYGPFMRRYESLFAKKHQAPYAIASNSGTDSLRVAVAALKEKYYWRDGDEVLVPATTFIATSNIVIQNNLKPVFVDIDSLYYGINPLLIEKSITRKTRAIIPVHLFGQPADMNPIMQIAKKKRLAVIEDSAETMLAKYGDRYVGSFGEIGCFSTYVAHLLTTGIGGLNTTRDPRLAVMLRSLVNHGRDSIYLNIDDDNKASGRKLHMILKKRFSFVRLGYSSRLTELEGAIGVAELEDNFEAQIISRRKNAERLTEYLKPAEQFFQLPAVRKGNEHSFMVYPIVLRKYPKRKLVEYLEAHGVETRDLMPLINQPVYRKLFRLDPRNYPISQWLIRSGFYVGCHQNLSQADLEYLAGLIRKFFKK